MPSCAICARLSGSTVSDVAGRIVTVDGPAGSGKSTLGRRLATALRLAFIDTGLFYRGVTLAAAERGIGAGDAEGLAEVARTATIEVGVDPSRQPEVRVNGREVSSAALHDPTTTELLAAVSRSHAVRSVLLQPQRSLAVSGAVAAGRDCGTVVFPDAPVKIYLDADASVRTTRRASQLEGHGAAVDVALLEREVVARDSSDASRAAAPLRRPPGSLAIDTGAVGIDEMVDVALDWCRRHGVTP